MHYITICNTWYDTRNSYTVTQASQKNGPSNCSANCRRTHRPMFNVLPCRWTDTHLVCGKSCYWEMGKHWGKWLGQSSRNFKASFWMCVLGMHFTVSSNGMSFQQRKLYRKGIRQRNAHPKRTTKTNKGNPWIVGLFQLTIQSVTRLVSAHHIPSKLSSFPVCFPHFKWSTYIQNKIEGRDRGGGEQV